MHLPSLLLGATLVSISHAKSSSKAKDAVLLSNVRTLTVQSSKQTTARRVSPIPQLTCIGGNAKNLYEVDVMRCRNSGSEYDAEDIQWTCQASLPPEFKLGGTEVVCEGFDSPEDPWVLKGSCGVEYRLVLTDVGWEKYKGSVKVEQERYATGSYTDSKGIGSQLFSLVFWAAFLAVVALILYSIFNNNPNARNAARNLGGGGGGWGGGGGGGGGNDDPPPPYTPRSPPRPKSYTSNPRSSSSRSSGPGFWGGAAGGAAMGYAAGRYAGGGRNQQQAPPPVAGPSNSWFGGGGGEGAGPSYYGGGGGGSSSGPASPPSSSRYESTGFGGSRRR